MLGFKSFAIAAATFGGIEMIHMTRKRQARYAYDPNPSIAGQLGSLLTYEPVSAWRFPYGTLLPFAALAGDLAHANGHLRCVGLRVVISTACSSGSTL